MRTPRARSAALLAAITLSAAAACSSSPKTQSSTATHRPPKHEAVAVGGCIMSVSVDLATEPTLSVPGSPACTAPPKKLEMADAIRGTGPAAKKGDDLKVNYVGLHWTNHQAFDASWGKGLPDGFDVSPLGTASVIPGWNQGLIGARAGDRRILALPASLAYGPAGSGTEIGPNEALIFIVDVISITPGSSAAPSG